MTLDEAREGMEAGRLRVVYAPPDEWDKQPEDGTIVRVGERYVFVRYDGSPTPKATHPDNLEWPVKVS